MSKIVFREDGCILVKDVRLSYEHVFKKWAKNPEKEKPKYSGKFMLDVKTHGAEIKALVAHVQKLRAEWFKEGGVGAAHIFFQDGANSGKPEYEGHWVISASEDTRPDVLNLDKSRVNEEDGIVYSGCYVNVLIRPWKQSNVHGKRINANLLAVQFKRDGEAFSSVSRPDMNEAFDDEGGDGGFGDDDIAF